MENKELIPDNGRRVFKSLNFNPGKTKYDDVTALNALKSGNEDAFTRIYNKYHQKLCIYTERIIMSVDAAEEAIRYLNLLK